MTAKAKFSEKELAQHREYMKKYQQASSDLHKNGMKYKDHYELLGLPRGAAHAEIRQAYRKLALKYHPDRNSSEEAQERWDGVPAAYAVLSNPNSRVEYDASLPTRDALVEFYKTYNPAKLDNATIQTIVDGWQGREVELFQMLNVKYEIAPHQGTNKTLQRAAASLSEERSRSISKDFASSDKDSSSRTRTRSWHGALSHALCCKGVVHRFFGAAYYEVDTKSPGLSNLRSVSETPGQDNAPVIQSPAPNAEENEPKLRSKPSEYDNVDLENVSSATTTDDECEWSESQCTDTTCEAPGNKVDTPTTCARGG